MWETVLYLLDLPVELSYGSTPLFSKLFIYLLSSWKPPLLCLHSPLRLQMCVYVCMAGAPMLSRLLEAGPTQFSAPLGFMVSADSASSAPLSTATPLPVDSTASASAGLPTLTHIQTAQRAVIHRLQPLHITRFVAVGFNVNAVPRPFLLKPATWD